MKQQCTSRGRMIVNDAMDVLGGAGICLGPANFMGTNYMATPIAITVEVKKPVAFLKNRIFQK